MCGLYADGEIGPEVCNAKLGLRWAGVNTTRAGKAAVAGSDDPMATGSKLQGFTTIVTSYSA